MEGVKMNLLQLRTLALNWLDDLNGTYFTPSIMNQWLNNSQTEVQKRLIKAGQSYFLKCVQTTLVVYQREYVLPDDFLKIHRLEVVTSGLGTNQETAYPLMPVIINQVDITPTNVGTPAGYYFKGNRISLDRLPDSNYTLKLYYSNQILDMTLDTDSPDLRIPPRYQELISLYAAESGFIKDGRAAELLVKRIKEYESHFDTDAQERNVDYPRMVNDMDPAGYGEIFW